MPLYYSLFDNPMTPDPTDRMAMTQVNQTLTMDDLFEDMTGRGSTVTKAEGLSVMEEFFGAIERAVKNGNAVSTPLFNIGMSITGVFANDEDSYDKARHQVKLRINPGKRLREMEAKIPVEKLLSEKKMPILLHFYDTQSESADEVITPQGGGRITGSALRFEESDANQGVFFINQSNGAATRVPGKLMRNKPGELIFLNPALPAGTYKIEVRSLLLAKATRTGVLPYELTVGA